LNSLFPKDRSLTKRFGVRISGLEPPASAALLKVSQRPPSLARYGPG
jgi:hypothetical protein